MGRFRAAIGADEQDAFENQLDARSLMTMRAEVSVGAYLMFAPNPAHLLPHAHVRILRYFPACAAAGRYGALLRGLMNLSDPLSVSWRPIERR